MNNTYNRILDLVVNERLEEGKKLDAVKAGVKKVGGAVKNHGTTAALTAAMLASTAVGVKNWDKHPLSDADKPAATAAAEKPSAEKPIVKPSAEKPSAKRENNMNKTYNRILNLVTEAGGVGSIESMKAQTPEGANSLLKHNASNAANTDKGYKSSKKTRRTPNTVKIGKAGKYDE
jgi:hypothetical protein